MDREYNQDMIAEHVLIYGLPEGWKSNPDYVYCGRPGKGMSGYWGNPIEMNVECPICEKTHTEGGDTLKCYEYYASMRLKGDPEFKSKLKALAGKKLVCFCKDSTKCHVSIMIELIEKLLRQEQFDCSAKLIFADSRANLSSASDSHFKLPESQKIINMGIEIVPAILEHYDKYGCGWHCFLHHLVPASIAPVLPEEDRGYVNKIRTMWLQWGVDQGHLSSYTDEFPDSEWKAYCFGARSGILDQ